MQNLITEGFAVLERILDDVDDCIVVRCVGYYYVNVAELGS